MDNTISEIISHVDLSSLKDNPQAQAMLMAFLSSTSSNESESDKQSASSPASSETTSVGQEVEKRKFDSIENAQNQTEAALRRVGRKPVTSEDEDSDDPKNKRKAQNRAAQRAFRERKENHVRLLEERVKELEKSSAEKSTELQLENKMLKEMITKLQTENATLLSSFSYPLSTNQSFEERPQKVARASSPQFDSFSSTASTSSTTPETSNLNDLLSFDTGLPSHTLLDHSELLGGTNDLDGLFTADPKQFDLFYALDHPVPKVEQDHTNSSPDKVVEVWEKFKDHPRFEEFDLDHLCDEMKKKAQCSDFDHTQELTKAVNEHYPIN
jgi:hypothetical protein